MPLDYAEARALLEAILADVESRILSGNAPAPPPATEADFEYIFRSRTQSFRETLVGCVLARIKDKSINIRLPYVNLAPNAFNGRTLDEQVVNPFMQRHRIPSTGGPYLAKGRRSIRFDESFLIGTRDRAACQSFLNLVGRLEAEKDDSALRQFLSYLLYRFVALREQTIIPISRLHRISVEQYGFLIDSLFEVRSGGRIPMFLVVAAFRAVNEYFEAGWEIQYQGINVADAAGGAGGDVTIWRGDETILAAEITERPIGRNRVLYTFNTKIAPQGIGDYLFFTSKGEFSTEVLGQARQYFTQGHEVNFLNIRDWIVSLLALIGAKGRDIFNRRLVELIEADNVPRNVKVAWNQRIEWLAAG